MSAQNVTALPATTAVSLPRSSSVKSPDEGNGTKRISSRACSLSLSRQFPCHPWIKTDHHRTTAVSALALDSLPEMCLNRTISHHPLREALINYHPKPATVLVGLAEGVTSRVTQCPLHNVMHRNSLGIIHFTAGLGATDWVPRPWNTFCPSV